MYATLTVYNNCVKKVRKRYQGAQKEFKATRNFERRHEQTQNCRDSSSIPRVLFVCSKAMRELRKPAAIEEVDRAKGGLPFSLI